MLSITDLLLYPHIIQPIQLRANFNTVLKVTLKLNLIINYMEIQRKRSPALLAIVMYKAFTALLLAITSIALFLTIHNYQYLADFSDEYALTGKREILKWLLEYILNLNPRTLQFSGIVTGLYAGVTTAEAIGLWYQQGWARILVLALVGISIPPEIYEIIVGISPLKLVILLVNLAVFWYLLRHSLNEDVTN